MKSISLLRKGLCIQVVLLAAVTAGSAVDPDFGKGDSWKPVITRYSHGKPAAVSLTFDDNCPCHLKYALPELDRRAMVGTFFVITEQVAAAKNWDAWIRASLSGHEIGSHTVSHPAMETFSPAAKEYQLRRSREVIDSVIPSQKCRTLALPYGYWDPDLMKTARSLYSAVRRVGNSEINRKAEDVYTMGGNIPLSQMAVTTMDAWIDDALSKSRWDIEIYHGIEEGGWELIPAERFAKHLDYIAARRDSLWIATYGDVSSYITARKTTLVRLVNYEDSVLRYALESKSATPATNPPLTVKVRLPDGWTDFRAEQGGKSVWSSFLWETAWPYALFECVPGAGEILLRRGSNRAAIHLALNAEDRLEFEPKANPKSGTYNEIQRVSLSSSNHAQMYYTLNGSEPGPASSRYVDPIWIADGVVVKFLAIDSAGKRSGVHTAAYKIKAKSMLKIAATNMHDSGARTGTVSFSVPSQGRTSLTFRDISGKELANLFNDYSEPLHEYTVPFSFDTLPPGVYVWGLEQNGKMLKRERAIFVH